MAEFEETVMLKLAQLEAELAQLTEAVAAADQAELLNHDETFPDEYHYAFGFKIDIGTSAGKVTIHKGYVDLNEPGNTTQLAIAETQVTLASGFNCVYIEYNLSTGAGSIKVNTDTTEASAMANADDTEDLLKFPLYCFEHDGGGTPFVELIRVYHRGNLAILPIPGQL